MDSRAAMRALSEGAVVLLLDVPVGTELGLDYNPWNAGPRFRGIKSVPPGIHFLFCASVAGGGGRQTGPRTGHFLELAVGQVAVFRFDPADEELHRDPLVEEALDENRQGLLEFLGGLAPYPFDRGLKSWLSLTSRIDGAVLARTNPPAGRIGSVPSEADSTLDHIVAESAEPQGEAAAAPAPMEECTAVLAEQGRIAAVELDELRIRWGLECRIS